LNTARLNLTVAKRPNSPPVSSLTAAARDALGIVRPGRRNGARQPNKETSGGGQHRLAKQEVVVTTHARQRGGIFSRVVRVWIDALARRRSCPRVTVRVWPFRHWPDRRRL